MAATATGLLQWDDKDLRVRAPPPPPPPPPFLPPGQEYLITELTGNSSLTAGTAVSLGGTVRTYSTSHCYC